MSTLTLLLLLAAALAIFVSGFSLGVIAGIKYQHRKLTREVAVQARDIRGWLEKKALSIASVFMIGMAVLTYQSQHESNAAVGAVQAQNACLTTYANRLYESLTPRQSAAETLQAADQKFNTALVALLKVAATTTDVDARHDAVVKLARAAQHKQQVADALSTERARNPYPSPPKQVCP